MKIKIFIVIAVFIEFGCLGCARAISPSREAYILAHEHGWVELSVVDANIPENPPPKDKKNRAEWKPGPPQWCSVGVKLNREEFLSDVVYPVGETAPYRVDSGFRFPAPIGDQVLEVRYSDCRVENGALKPVTQTLPISVKENFVLPVLFDGETLSAAKPEQNQVVTLGDIDSRLQRIEHKISGK